jgi:hypothetical protein
VFCPYLIRRTCLHTCRTEVCNHIIQMIYLHFRFMQRMGRFQLWLCCLKPETESVTQHRTNNKLGNVCLVWQFWHLHKAYRKSKRDTKCVHFISFTTYVWTVSCTMGTGSFPGVKRPGRGVDHPHSPSAEVKERAELYLYSPSGPSWPVLGWTLPLPMFETLFASMKIL